MRVSIFNPTFHFLIISVIGIALPACGQGPEADTQNGAGNNVNMALGISRTLALSPGETKASTSDGTSVTGRMVQGSLGEPDRFLLIPMRKGATKVTFRSSTATTRQLSVTVYDEETKRDEIIEAQSADEIRRGFPVKEITLRVGTFVDSSPTARNTGAIFITDPSLVRVDRQKDSARIVALKIGVTDVDIYDEAGVLAWRFYVRTTR